jgi:uncharacterized protein YuzE
LSKIPVVFAGGVREYTWGQDSTFNKLLIRSQLSVIMKIPMKHMWVDYDKEADVLYVSFRKPQRSKKTIELNDDILVRKDGKEIVGITILNASTKARDKG